MRPIRSAPFFPVGGGATSGGTAHSPGAPPSLYLVDHGAKVMVYTTMGVTPGWAVKNAIEGQQAGSQMRLDFERLRDAMIAHGAKWPPDPPPVVREWTKGPGMRVAK